jgi:hypothetical protein
MTTYEYNYSRLSNIGAVLLRGIVDQYRFSLDNIAGIKSIAFKDRVETTDSGELDLTPDLEKMISGMSFMPASEVTLRRNDGETISLFYNANYLDRSLSVHSANPDVLSAYSVLTIWDPKIK